MKCTKCKSNTKLVFSGEYTYEGQKINIRLCKVCLKVLVKTLLDVVDYIYYRSTLQIFSGQIIEKKQKE